MPQEDDELYKGYIYNHIKINGCCKLKPIENKLQKLLRRCFPKQYSNRKLMIQCYLKNICTKNMSSNERKIYIQKRIEGTDYVVWRMKNNKLIQVKTGYCEGCRHTPPKISFDNFV